MSSRLLLLARQGTAGRPGEGETEEGGGGGGGGGMSLSFVLGIAIGGGVFLFMCLAFFLVALAGRRHRALAQARSATPGARLDLESEEGDSIPTPSPRPRRLKKQKPDQAATHTEKSQDDKQHRPLLSFILSRSNPLRVFGGLTETVVGGQQRGGHIRKNSSWIDEDAIHGPMVQSDGKRLSVRDSFILRTPTLPDLFGDQNKDDFKFPDDYVNYTVQQPLPVGLPAQHDHPPQVAAIRRTASYELAEKLAAAARGGIAPAPQSFQGPVPRPVPSLRLRHKTTESDLAEILRSTEERLQNGTPGDSRPVTRQRVTSASEASSINTQHPSPTKSSSPVKAQSPIKSPSPVKSHSPARSESPANSQMLKHVVYAFDTSKNQRARTPSPSKHTVVSMLTETPGHDELDISQYLTASDVDSFFGETTPGIEHMSPKRLSTPSRRSENNSPIRPVENAMSTESPDSDASSCLSTLYSINEPEDDRKTGSTGQWGSIIRDRETKGLITDTRMCDPFVTPAPPGVPQRSPRRRNANLASEGIVDVEAAVYAPLDSWSGNNDPMPGSLNEVRGNSAVDQSRTQASVRTWSPDTAPSSETIRPKSVMSMKPVFLVSSASAVSLEAYPGTLPEDNVGPPIPSNRLTFGQDGTVIPPPLDLKPDQRSPLREPVLLGSSESIRHEDASPSADSGSGFHTPTSPARRNQPSPGLLDGSPKPITYKRRDMTSPTRGCTLYQQPHSRDNFGHGVPRVSNCPSIIRKPPDSPKRSPSHRDFGAMGLQSTVAQLRRMNSQVSDFSTGSSISDPDSPTLPDLRGGGFSPGRSNSRVSKIGRQNYLAIGMSPKAKRRNYFSINSAENSIAMLEDRSELNKHLGSLQAAIGENGEEAGAGSVVRGPRPLIWTPRSAERGDRREAPRAANSPTGPRTMHDDREDQRCHKGAKSEPLMIGNIASRDG